MVASVYGSGSDFDSFRIFAMAGSDAHRNRRRSTDLFLKFISSPIAMGDCEKKNLEMEMFHLIDVSFEDDCLIASPFSSFRDLQSPENQNVHRSFDLFEAGQTELVPLPSESLEPERARKFGKCNLRKSLAWDSAFFTSAGVLDPEELSILNKGVKKAEPRLLPGIQEDLRRSAESNSSLDSDSWTLESLEGDLFEDIRASIQKSSKASIVACSSSKGLGESSMHNIRSSKKLDLTFRNRPDAGSGVSISSFPKPPRILGRTNPISTAPTKRASLGANCVRNENSSTKAASVAGRGVMVSKMYSLGDSCSVTPLSTPSPKSSTSGSPTATTMELTSSSHNRSGSASSDTSGKCPSNFMRRKIDSRNVNLDSSALKTPQRSSSRNKSESGNSHLSSYLMSMSKLSSSISSASSIDGWSSESSSSSSTVKQKSNNLKPSLDTSSPCRGVSFNSDAPQVLDLQNHPHYQPGLEHENQGTELLSQHAKKTLIGTGGLSCPAPTDVSRSFKPSGLRMPSPKLGFFDAEQSALCTPNVGLPFHSGVRSGLPKIGAGISNRNGGANKTKPIKLQPARTRTGSGDIKIDSQKTASSMKPISLAQFQELSNASLKVSATQRTMEVCRDISLKVKNDLSPKASRKSRLKTREVRAEGPDTAKCGTDSGFSAEEKNVGPVNMGTESKGQLYLKAIKISTSKEDSISSDVNSGNCENINPSQQVDEEAKYSQHHLENYLHPLHKSNEKKNSFHFEDQANGLSRNVGAVVQERTRKKGASLSKV
ncbi:hypothetical protein HHK36_016552 [Tetracentron sinense]|uniref:Uncharacterized protein n=1 Tax=Tetracentron sinense TaxID=13715 RepID=A0A834Z0J3_TETSI|nr:hypothetical protein HHK36_016552 [Tetracentron sinense]